MEGVPGFGSISTVIRKYHYLKKDCLHSFMNCGSRYNRAVFAGPYDECGSIDVFGIYKESVNEKRAHKYVKFLLDHYDFPLWHSPQGLE